MQATYPSLIDHLRQTEHLESIHRLLTWDQHTYMPPGAAAARADQTALLSGWIHQRRTDPRLAEWLADLEQQTEDTDPHADQAVNVRWIRRDYQRQQRLPQRLVEQLTRETVIGQQLWFEARRENDFPRFLPQLQKIVALIKEKADALGHDGDRYEPLLDEYEPGAKTADLRELLQGLAKQLKPLVQRAVGSASPPTAEALRGEFPTAAQQAFNRRIVEQIGFDFQQGRIDVSPHPFCEGIAPGDCRITTRYDERWLAQSFFGTLHEMGHGLYEQGLPAEHFGQPLGQFISLGMHESQSRMWENMVGRGRPFWQFALPIAQQHFPTTLAGVDVDDVYRAVNVVQPSLTRVEADETTYNLHIGIRFELETALMADELEVADLPEAWNQKYDDYLGIRPPTDAAGVLQDLHWSAGVIGYFPTYALGNLYAAQMFEVVHRDLGELDAQLSAGRFEMLLQWLREHLHRHGRRYTPEQLIERISGRPLEPQPLLNYLTGKLERVYGW